MVRHYLHGVKPRVLLRAGLMVTPRTQFGAPGLFGRKPEMHRDKVLFAWDDLAGLLIVMRVDEASRG